MRPSLKATQQLQIESLANTMHDIFFILVLQMGILVLLGVYLFWVYKRTNRDAQDWFKNYHEAYHAANPDTSVLPPKSLASKTGHAVVHEPIVVPPADPVDDTEEIAPVVHLRGKHMAIKK